MTAVTSLEERAPEQTASPRRRLPAGGGFYALVGLLALLLTIPVLDLAHGSLSVPFVYSHDGLSTSVHVKNVLERGWVDYTPGVAAPWGRHGNDFPSADNLHLMIMSAMGLFTNRYGLVLNAYFILTFPLIAMAAAWWFRTLGLSRSVAAVLALLFAYAPYHFERGEWHLFLSGYYAVPLVAVLLYRAVAGESLWTRKPTGLRGWLTGRNVGTVAILAVLGTSSSYYSVFSLLLLTLAGLVALAQTRRWRTLAGVVVAQGWLVAVMIANMAPNMVYEWRHGPNLVVPVRAPSGTETYSFKLSSLLLPWRQHRVDGLARFRETYDSAFPLPSEHPALGLVAAAGLVYLFAIVFVHLVRPRTSSDAPQRRLAVLAMGGFLLGTVGGLATFFALFVTDSLRSWDRLSIFLAVFALAGVGLVLDRGRAWLAAHVAPPRARYGVTCVLAALLLGVGLYDQTPPDMAQSRSEVAASWRAQGAFVAEIERRLPAQAMVFQLPYMYFPEAPRLFDMHDSDQFRMYLHSTTLRWSYGGIRGRPDSDWPVSVSRESAPRMAALVAVAGFSGVQIDRNGYRDRGFALEQELATLLNVEPLVSADHRYSFWDLREHAAGLRATHPAQELAEVAKHVVLHPVGYTIDVPRPSPSVVLDNAWTSAQPAEVSLTVRVKHGLPPLVIRWPDGTSEQVAAGAEETTVHRRLLLPTGRSTVQVSAAPGSRVPLELKDVLVDDPVLTAFVP